MSGWIRLHRKMLDNPIVCKDSDHAAVWMFLLLEATHKEQPKMFAGKKIMLQPGQLITGRKKISDQFNIHESKVQRILKSFENEQQIEQQTSNTNRLITILSWGDYQKSEQQDEQPVNNERTTDEQPVNTNKNERSKDIYTGQFEQFWEVYPRKVKKKRAFELWNRRLKHETAENLILCAKNYADECERKRTSSEYIMHAGTFLSDKLDYQDYLSKPEEKRPPLRVINGVSELVIATDEDKEWLDHVRRKQAERNGVTVNW